jgi:hypothetical protein
MRIEGDKEEKWTFVWLLLRNIKFFAPHTNTHTFFDMLGNKLGSSFILGKCITTELHSPVLFAHFNTVISFLDI